MGPLKRSEAQILRLPHNAHVAEWYRHYAKDVGSGGSSPLMGTFASEVQLDERLATDQEAVGSNPTRSTYGFYSVEVCTAGCGPVSTGSIPVRTPNRNRAMCLSGLGGELQILLQRFDPVHRLTCRCSLMVKTQHS
jgi:hypothetical protein